MDRSTVSDSSDARIAPRRAMRWSAFAWAVLVAANAHASGGGAIATWNEVAANAVLATGYPAVTPEEQRTIFSVDLATIQVAVYDAVGAIVGGYKPFAARPTAPTTGASAESATGAATCRVLSVLFPNRAPVYSSACASFLPTSTGDTAHVRGVAVGVDVADKILALRANDGRSANATYTPSGAPGNFVPAPPGSTPVGVFNPYVRPFTLSYAAQFRAYGPPDLTSAQYTEDFDEIKAVGGTVSQTRTPDQEELARFATENPGTYAARNYRRLADDHRSLAENARLFAMIWVAQGDVTIACFDSKYFFASWRPRAAIPAADQDGNPATVADPSWTPFVPTPNHPEYPAAHTCADGAFAETVRNYFGTKHVEFDFDSTATGTTRHYEDTDAYVRDIALARIYGGMHFRTSTEAGADMGRQVAKWVARNYFRPPKSHDRRDD